MTTDDYLDAVKERLFTDPLVLEITIVRERVTATDGHLRARLRLSGGDTLEFSEYVQLSASGQITVVTYSYHWCRANGELIKRWDNTPHFPRLPNFPHHIHVGDETTVVAGHPPNIFRVLDEISANRAG